MNKIKSALSNLTFERAIKLIPIFLSIIILAILFVLNIFGTSNVLTYDEKVELSYVTAIDLFLELCVVSIIIFAVKKLTKINFENCKIKIRKYLDKIIIAIALIIYSVVSIVWINSYDVVPIDDSKSVNDYAIKFVEGDFDGIYSSGLISKTPQQIGMVWVFGAIYKIAGTTDYHLFQYLNVVANVLTIIGLYLIIGKLKIKDKKCSLIYFILILTFIPLIILTTYVYGDYIGLALAVWAMFFAIKYKDKKNIINLIISGILCMLSYMVKMNYIIFVIAIGIYLFLNTLKEKKTLQKILEWVIIILYLLISILPVNTLKNCVLENAGVGEKEALPTSGYIYMGMSESSRTAGWYGDAIMLAWTDTEESYTEYPKLIKQRIKELIKHPRYAVRFYVRKTLSGWTDPYFQSIWYHTNLEGKDETLEEIFESKSYYVGKIYQKALLILIYGGALICVIMNRKNMSNEMLLLFIVAIGGFLFHTIWEMKARYTLPYVIILIPLASIGITNILNKFKKGESK